jgi:hypothetical protein
MYTEFTAGNKDYRLRLNTRAIITLEKAIGCNPLSIFGDGETIPPVSTMIAILHAALQPLEHGISYNDACDIFDDYLDDGHQMTDFLAVIVEIYKASGLIKDVEVDEKNA